MATTANEVLEFWFNELAPPDWFKKSDQTDAAITTRFRETHADLMNSRAAHWRSAPEDRLAAVIVLDQFSRNMFRGTPAMFASDPLALEVALEAIDAGDLSLHAPDRGLFLLLPLEHAEDMALQDRCVALMRDIFPEPGNTYVDFAERHRDVIERFGRFPHRNDTLGRASTPAEQAFLQQPGSGF
ncbi:MAG: DUF924 family protein [Pseudomonadota bacterium]